MIIRDNDQEMGSADTSAYTLVSADGKVELSLQLTEVLSDDFREHLAAQGFLVTEGDARSVVSAVVVATAANPAAWTAVGGMVVAFLRRHRGKVHRFEVEGRSVSIEGYSARDAEQLAADVLALSRKRGTHGGSGGISLGSRT